ncbi:MFS transporter [Halorientalis regularis]|uniref:MFS transporter n=1 Tax=Halorientalis regularis TaxID=660518 RepID=UPI000B8713C0|nr:MFS transporter [Halorientalis regularis]
MISAATLLGEDSTIIRDRSFQLLLLANFSPPLGSALISPLLDTLVGPFAVSETEIGLLMTAFTAPSIVLIPLVGVLADRVGRKLVMIGGLLCFGIGGVAIAFTTDFQVALALRLLQGIGFAGLTPIIVTSIGDLYRGGAEATAQGVRFATSGFTLMTFPLLGGTLAAIAWQYPFFLYALTFPTAVLIALFFEEPTSEDTRQGSADTDLGDLLEFVSRPRVASVLVGRAIPNFLYTAFLTYNSFVVVQLIGGSPGEAGLLITAASVFHTASATQAGRITALFDSRLYPLLGANLSMGAGFAVVGLAGSLPVALIGSAGVGLGFGTSLSLYRSVITGFTVESLRGSVVSAGSALGRVGATVAPIVMGVAVASTEPLIGFDAAVRSTVVAAALLCGIGGTACLLVARWSPAVEPTSG